MGICVPGSWNRLANHMGMFGRDVFRSDDVDSQKQRAKITWTLTGRNIFYCISVGRPKPPQSFAWVLATKFHDAITLRPRIPPL